MRGQLTSRSDTESKLFQCWSISLIGGCKRAEFVRPVTLSSRFWYEEKDRQIICVMRTFPETKLKMWISIKSLKSYSYIIRVT